MNSRILLLGGHPAGVETLKNMVLPGTGFISVVDGQKVTDRDLGNNFFVEAADIGKDRAEVIPLLTNTINNSLRSSPNGF